MDEPTQWEIIRDIQADVRFLREQDGARVNKEIYDRDQKDTDRRLTALENGRQEWKRWALTSVLGPLLVGAILFFVLGAKP